MSNYSALKTDINNNIYENNTQQITGTILNTVLKDMVNTLGAGYQFAGCAYLDLNPGAPDAKVFYLAGEGLYTNFDNIQVPAGKLGILKWDTRWHLETIEGLGGGGANLTGYISVASTDNLPDVGQPTIGYLCGTNLYLYVGEGGDTKDGKYQNCGSFRGPEGVGITEIEQVEQSTENGGRNTIRIHLSNGTSYDVYTRNGTTSTGLFPTLADLQAAHPTPVVGQYAFVGAGFPADIYVCQTAGTWTDSGADYDGDNVDLTNYATKAELAQLEHKVDDLSTGKYYGYFATSADLPDDATVDGFAYVGTASPYTIYNLRSGVWTSSGITVNQSPIGNEEDIDQNEDGKLQFANRVYNSAQPNGMGYKILRKDATFASQVTDTNTIYEIRYDFTISDTFTAPANCVLRFVGGSLSGGTLSGVHTCIDAQPVKIFNGTLLSGSFDIPYILSEWFGAKGDGTTDDADAIQEAENASFATKVKLHFLAKYYVIKKTISINQHNAWEGENISAEPEADKLTTLYFGIANATFLQYTGNGTPQRRAFKGIYFKSFNTSNTLFDCGFDAGVVENCKVHQFGTVFNQFLLHCSIVQNCKFTSVRYNFLVGSLTDSVITGNYISGYRPSNPLCFTGSINHSKITNNFFDYFKFVIQSYGTTTFNNSIVANNTFDYCYKPIDLRYNTLGVSIVGNTFVNISNSIGGAVGFNAPDEEMQANPPACFFFGDVSAAYVEQYTSRILNASIVGNYFEARIYINGRGRKTTMLNTYGKPSDCVISYTSDSAGDSGLDKSYIDLVHLKNFDNIKNAVLYDGAEVVHKDAIVRFIYKFENGVYLGNTYNRWVNATGMGALQDNPNPQIQALINGWIPMDFFSNSYISNGVVAQNGNYERSDFVDISRYANGVKLVNGDAAQLVLNLFDANKVFISSQAFMGGQTITLTTSDATYFVVSGNWGRLANFHAEAL